jgi:hypothetical protein
MGLFGFPAQAITVSAEKLHAYMALYISNIGPLEIKYSYFYMRFWVVHKPQF